MTLLQAPGSLHVWYVRPTALFDGEVHRFLSFSSTESLSHKRSATIACVARGISGYGYLVSRVNALVQAGQFALLSKQYTSHTPSASRHPATFWISESLARRRNVFTSPNILHGRAIRRASRVVSAQRWRTHGKVTRVTWF